LVLDIVGEDLKVLQFYKTFVQIKRASIYKEEIITDLIRMNILLGFTLA
jgi:hypothetical protein